MKARKRLRAIEEDRARGLDQRDRKWSRAQQHASEAAWAMGGPDPSAPVPPTAPLVTATVPPHVRLPDWGASWADFAEGSTTPPPAPAPPQGQASSSGGAPLPHTEEDPAPLPPQVLPPDGDPIPFLDDPSCPTCRKCGHPSSALEDLSGTLLGGTAHPSCEQAWRAQATQDEPGRFRLPDGGAARAPPVILDFFSGDLCAPLCVNAALRQRGFAVESYDKCLNAAHDVLDDAFFDKIMNKIQAKTYNGSVLGPPCGPRSRARNRPGGGPPPLSSREFIWGLLDLPPHKVAALTENNEIIIRTVLIAQALHDAGAWFVLEHTADLGDSPSIWLLDLVADMVEATGATAVRLDMRFWGAATTKPAELRGTLGSLEVLGGRDWSALPALRAEDTAQSAAYPPGFTARLADLAVASYVASRPSAGKPAPSHRPWISHSRQEVEQLLEDDPAERELRHRLGCSESPLVVKTGAKFRPFSDGGGLASLGRWNPRARPAGGLQDFAAALYPVILDMGLIDKLKTPFHSGKGLQGPPWDPDEVSRRALDAWDQVLTTKGLIPLDRTIEPGQPHRCRVIGRLLHLVSDPDAEWASYCQMDGVAMTVFERTPLIFREKTRWRLPEGDLEISAIANYSSAELATERISDKLREGVEAGQIKEASSIEEAAKICGCDPSELVIQKLGEVGADSAKPRTILDATATGTNHLIRVPDALEMPGLPEEEVIMREAMMDQPSPHPPASRFGIIKMDVKGAHMLIKKRRQDWRRLVVTIGGVFYIYMVGAFGESSAAYWWSRFYACEHRLLYHLLPGGAWGLVYVDDTAWHLPLLRFWETATLLMVITSIFNTPMSWRKTEVGISIPWVGFSINLMEWTVGISSTRLAHVREAVKPILEWHEGYSSTLAAAAGTLCHVVQALPLLRPLLQPLFSFLAEVGQDDRWVRWPARVRRAVACILKALEDTPQRHIEKFRVWLPGWGASDGSGGVTPSHLWTEQGKRDFLKAMREGGSFWPEYDERPVRADEVCAIFHPDSRRFFKPVNLCLAALQLPIKFMTVNPPRVGGWWADTHKDAATKAEARWFSETIPLDIIPCVLQDSSGPRPAGASSLTVELMGALILMTLRAAEADGPEVGGWGGAVSGQTDSRGSQYAVAKLYSSAEPGASIVRGMAKLCAARDIAPALTWEPRAANTWADDLSKDKTEGFAVSNRRHVDWPAFKSIQDDFDSFARGGRGAEANA